MLYVPGVTPASGGVDARTVATFQVLPGWYAHQFASGYYADYAFEVTRLLAGSGVLPVIPQPSWIRYQQVRLVPAARYQVVQGSGPATFAFALDHDGRFRYAAPLDVANGGFLRGSGTSTIEFLGYPVCVDVRPLGSSVRFAITPVWGMPLSTSPIELVRLLPHTVLTLRTSTAGNTRLQFALAPDGTVHAVGDLSRYLRVERVGGLTVLTVLALPPG